MFFESNKNIIIVNYNLITFNNFDVLNRFIYKRFLGMPRPQNVLIPCINFAINFGFKEINLLGIDHSWTKFIFTDDKNRVCLMDQHFYDKKDNDPIPMRKVYGEYYKMHQLLIDFSLMFEGYHIIRRFGDYMKAKIYNRTINSFVDAFERKNNID
jgi:hypothetical protein